MLPHSTTLLAVVLSVIRKFAHGAGEQFFLQTVDARNDARTPILDDEFAAWLNETGSIRGMKGVAIAVTRRNKDGEGWSTETKGFGVADRWGNLVDDQVNYCNMKFG
jgi:hypothetical protein